MWNILPSRFQYINIIKQILILFENAVSKEIDTTISYGCKHLGN